MTISKIASSAKTDTSRDKLLGLHIVIRCIGGNKPKISEKKLSDHTVIHKTPKTTQKAPEDLSKKPLDETNRILDMMKNLALEITPSDSDAIQVKFSPGPMALNEITNCTRWDILRSLDPRVIY